MPCLGCLGVGYTGTVCGNVASPGSSFCGSCWQKVAKINSTKTQSSMQVDECEWKWEKKSEFGDSMFMVAMIMSMSVGAIVIFAGICYVVAKLFELYHVF